MGMSASQARYLQLTARKSNTEYESQQVCQERAMLANEMDHHTGVYNDAISNRHLFFVSNPNPNPANSDVLPRLTYGDVTNSFADGGLGYRIVNLRNSVIVPGLPPSPEIGVEYEIDLNCLSSDYLEKKLYSGEWLIQQNSDYANNSDSWKSVPIAAIGSIQDNLNTEDDAAAERQYNQQTASFQHKDKMLEMRLKQLDTEHKTLETEMDSVKKVIDKNVESSFKTFA